MKCVDAGSSHAWQLLVRFFFAQRERLSTGGEGQELSPAQWHVLHLIQPEEPVSMGRLAETLGCDASNVTGLIDRLEARGLVERRAAAGDRRVKALHLTPAGSRLRAQLLRQIAGGSCRLARLSPQDQRTLVRILETLIDDQR